MTGIEILSSTAVTTWPAWTAVVAFVVAAIVTLAATLWSDNVFFGLVAGIFAFLLCATIFGVGGVGEYETGEYIYKVTIDDSVSMNEFLDKYEIIDQEGKIYTVKEKES